MNRICTWFDRLFAWLVMNRLCTWVVMLCLTLGVPLALWWWEQCGNGNDAPENNLRGCWLLYAVVGLVGLVVFLRDDRRFARQRQRQRQLSDMLAEAARLQQCGQGREADRLLDQCRDVFILVYGRSPESYLPAGIHPTAGSAQGNPTKPDPR